MFVSKYSVEDKKRWMEEFKSSGKSTQAYAREIGIPPTTMRFWLEQEINKNYMRSNKSSNTTSFGTIKILGEGMPDNTYNTSNSIRLKKFLKFLDKSIKVLYNFLIKDHPL